MRSVGLAVAILAVCAVPALAQQPGPGGFGMPKAPSNKVDLGNELTKLVRGDGTTTMKDASTPSSAPSSSGSGGFAGFLNSLLPKGNDYPAGTGPATITVEGTARADDANVLEITKADGSVVKVRQWGIEAPETKQWPWGPRARGELDRLLNASGGKVKCTSDGSTTRSGNLVARCFAGETDISATLIEGGYGVEWREVSRGAYTQLEATAQSQKRGVWSGQ